MAVAYGLLMFVVAWGLLSLVDAPLPESHLSMAIGYGIVAAFGYRQGRKDFE